MMRLNPSSLTAVLVLLASSPTLVTAFWWRNVKEIPETVASVVKDGKECKDEVFAGAVPVVNNSVVDVDGGPMGSDYGMDISFPMAHASVSTNCPWLPHNVDPSIETPEEYKDMPLQPLGDRQAFYENYIQGCVDTYDGKGQRCIENERERVAMNLRQPQSMKNYTEHGFRKIRAPEHLFQLLTEFWEANKDKQSEESWPAGNTYVNHWEGRSYMVDVADPQLKHGGYVLKQHIWNAARDMLTEWTGHQMAECSLYGIRVYKEGAILAPHVDRLPLVSSAIINVDQDVDEPWPLEVIGHDGKAHNVTMLPGDLVLYESHSIIHGRPFPLKGRFMANVFIHFEPIGPVDGELEIGTSDLPPYIIPGSPEEPHWRTENPDGHEITGDEVSEEGATEAHVAASEAHLEELRRLVEVNEGIVNAQDQNGWTPLHEAVRSENIEVVRFLLESGADVNLRTIAEDGGKQYPGGSTLYWALKFNDRDDPLIALLLDYGAKNYVPLEKEEVPLPEQKQEL